MGQKDIWKKMSWKVAWIIVGNYVKRLKADWKIPEDKKLSLHMERHSFAMKCVYSGLSQQATTQLMRHKDPKITMYYYHMNDERLLNQYDRIQ
jgi:site-specific recombinase XerD